MRFKVESATHTALKAHSRRAKVEAKAKRFFDVCRSSLIFLAFAFAFAQFENTLKFNGNESM